jgi:hypothetical protein
MPTAKGTRFPKARRFTPLSHPAWRLYAAAVAGRSSGRPTVFGWTSTGKHLAVTFEIVDKGLPQVWWLPRSRYRLQRRSDEGKNDE